MTLLRGFNHVGMLTHDLDRLYAFYRDVFEATITPAVNEDGMRMSLIEVGPHAALNVFEISDNTEADKQTPMFGRGRLDHFGLNASSREALEEVRQRLIRLGASDGTVTDFGSSLSVFFRDPDGLEAEVVWIKDAAALAESSA
jgi:catechol 2,3-dioxygenase-like lactoylglutathione lyase family enzyme